MTVIFFQYFLHRSGKLSGTSDEESLKINCRPTLRGSSIRAGIAKPVTHPCQEFGNDGLPARPGLRNKPWFFAIFSGSMKLGTLNYL